MGATAEIFQKINKQAVKEIQYLYFYKVYVIFCE